MDEILRDSVLTWQDSPPPHDQEAPILFRFNASSFEVLYWYESRGAFCQGFGGWGDDRYTDNDVNGIPWARLTALQK